MNPDPTSLDRLHDIVVPGPVPWWPLASGWWWLAALVAGFAFAFALRWFLHHQRNRYRREALAELGRCESLLGDDVRRIEGVAAIAVLLKRAALTAWPREQVAALTGPAWYAFLDRTKGGGAGQFACGPGRWLDLAAFDPRSATSLGEAEAHQLAALARDWIARHRTEVSLC